MEWNNAIRTVIKSSKSLLNEGVFPSLLIFCKKKKNKKEEGKNPVPWNHGNEEQRYSEPL